MTKKELLKELKKLPEGEVLIRIENELYYPIKEIYLEKVNNTTIVINCREVNLQKESKWEKV